MDYIKAGEFYGLLLQSLGFGELAMFQRGRGMLYQWEFQARGKPYCCQYTVTNLAFCDEELESLAGRTAENWKGQFRRLDDGLRDPDTPDMIAF